MNNKGLVVYVGPYSFPNGGAAARRIYGNVLSLKSAGYDVKIATGQMQNEAPENDVYLSIPIYSLNERKYENLPKLMRLLLYFFIGKDTIDWLDNLKDKPAAVILYSGYSPYLLRLIKWTRKNKVKLIFDTVEWYDPPNIFSKLFSPYYLNIEFTMRFLLKKTKNLIVISSYLERYYQKKGCNIIRIPPTIDGKSIKPRLIGFTQGKLTLAFAGTIGAKDLLDTVIQTILELEVSKIRIKLSIAGFEEKEFYNLNSLKGFDKSQIRQFITFYGRVSHEKALEIVRQADFSIIVRPPSRSVAAGFPTKFVESMAVGTPVIANITSDLGDYIVDSVNGLICKGYDVHAIKEQLLKALEFEQDKYLEMRIAARTTALKFFNFNKYDSDLNDFIS